MTPAELEQVHKFLRECELAGIYNPVQWIKAKTPQIWSSLKDCFPRGILPTDIDGWVEMNHQFLILENKPADILRNSDVPKGQACAFARLIDIGCFTVFWIGRDNAGNPVHISIWLPSGESFEKDPCDRNYLQGLCCDWSAWADKQPRFLKTRKEKHGNNNTSTEPKTGT